MDGTTCLRCKAYLELGPSTQMLLFFYTGLAIAIVQDLVILTLGERYSSLSLLVLVDHCNDIRFISVKIDHTHSSQA
jgi:hypothetical protein